MTKLMWRSMTTSMLPITMIITIIAIPCVQSYHTVSGHMGKFNMALWEYMLVVFTWLFAAILMYCRKLLAATRFKTVDELVEGDLKRPGYTMMDVMLLIMYTGEMIASVLKENYLATPVLVMAAMIFVLSMVIAEFSVAYKYYPMSKVMLLVNCAMQTVALILLLIAIFPSTLKSSIEVKDIPNTNPSGIESNIIGVAPKNPPIAK